MLDFLSTLGLLLVLLRLTFVDLRCHRLPDIYTLPLILTGVVLAGFEGGIGLRTSAIGGCVGFGAFWFVGHWYFARYGVEGLGQGDAKLFAASGTWLGYYYLPFVLLIASVGCLAFALLRSKTSPYEIAFGPWLSAGFFLIWIKVTFPILG